MSPLKWRPVKCRPRQPAALLGKATEAKKWKLPLNAETDQTRISPRWVDTISPRRHHWGIGRGEDTFAVAQGHPRGPKMGSLKSPCTTSYWSSIETIALNCLVFWEKRVLYTRFRREIDRQTNRQTNEQTNRRTSPSRKVLSCTSCGGSFTIKNDSWNCYFVMNTVQNLFTKRHHACHELGFNTDWHSDKCTRCWVICSMNSNVIVTWKKKWTSWIILLVLYCFFVWFLDVLIGVGNSPAEYQVDHHSVTLHQKCI